MKFAVIASFCLCILDDLHVAYSFWHIYLHNIFPKNLCYNLHLLILGYNVLYILCYERIPERINILLNLMFMI